MRRSIFGLSLVLGVMALMTGCTFNFDVTSQRTALENQVMGSYRELDDDLILASSVRGPLAASARAQAVSTAKQPALDARANQMFNKDDLEELKDDQIIGEAANGNVLLIPKGLAGVPASARGQMDLARQISDEENRDRAVIWQRIIESNPTLTAKDLPDVRRTYAKMQREGETAGQWYEGEDGRWERKPGTPRSGT